jgi:hypothetical protein
MTRPLPVKPMVFACVAALGALAPLAPLAASAGPLAVGTLRVGPPTPFVNSLGGGLGAHTDHALIPGGGGGGSSTTGQGPTARPASFAECYRRAYLRLEKLDASMGYAFISATARHICGA